MFGTSSKREDVIPAMGRTFAKQAFVERPLVHVNAA